MGELYQFKCLECNLEFKFRREKGENVNHPTVKFHCEICGKISSQHPCKNCNEHLQMITYPLKGVSVELYKEEGEIKINCPNCSSEHTLVIQLDNWIMDYQIW